MPESEIGKEELAGVERFRMIYREIKAEEMGASVPNLGKLLREAEESLIRAGVKDESVRNRFKAEEHDRILRRWRSEFEALGSLVDPDERKRIETEIGQSILKELEGRGR